MVGRIKFLQVVILIVFGVVAVRAFEFQVMRPGEIIDRANKRFERTVELTPHRGSIFDRKGQPLAVSIPVKSVGANPRIMDNPHMAASLLAGILGLDRPALDRRLAQRRCFTWIKRQVTPEEAERVKRLGIKGVGLYDETRRFYPESESMANLIGIVNIDGCGLEGLELHYDALLKGRDRRITVQKDGMGRIIYARGIQPDSVEDGGTLWLTVDRRIQHVAYEVLKKAVMDNRAESGFVIISSPSTGEVLALASYPSFDPNTGSYRSLLGHSNMAITHAFEPGSVIKPIWICWGLEKRYFNLSKSVFCENGAYILHRFTIHDHEGYGWLGVSDVVKYSSNIGIAKLMDPLKASDMYDCLGTFGLLEPTGIDFPGEPAGSVRQPGSWRALDKANIAFGQGFAVTGIQLVTAFNAMINGGIIMRPYLVGRVADAKNRTVTETSSTIVHRAISEQTSAQIMGVMKAVTAKGGTGESAALPTFDVFGKTGTAQKVDLLTGTYVKGDYVSSFIGGVADSTGRPRMTMMVCINEPRGDYYASTVACPLFKEIVMQCATIMELNPNITIATTEGRQ